MKISASIYSGKEKSLPQLVKELDAYRIDYLHVDCNDDASVFNDIAEIRKISRTPVDLHLISDHPEKYWDLVSAGQVEWLTLQYENLASRPEFPKGLTTRFGLSLVSSTPVNAFAEYADVCSLYCL